MIFLITYVFWNGEYEYTVYSLSGDPKIASINKFIKQIVLYHRKRTLLYN